MSAPVKISIVYPSDPIGLKVGGPETFLKGFIKYAPTDFDIEYVGLTADRDRMARGWADLKEGSTPYRFLPIYLEKNENKRSLIPVSFRFTASVLTRRLDVRGRVLLFDRIEPAAPFRFAREPKIGVIHNDIPRWLEKGKSEVVWSKAPWLYFLYEGWVFPSWDSIYSVNENTLALYAKKYPGQSGKFGFLPTWADPDVFHPTAGDREALRTRLGAKAPASDKWVLFVGRFQEQKAPIRLIESFAAALALRKDLSLVLVGEGNLRASMETRAKELGVSEKVFFVGNMDQKTLALYYRAADVLLLTSHFEGMPRCVLEALASGVPVVTTNAGEVKRLVRNGVSGEIVASDAAVIGKAVVDVLANQGRYTAAACVESAGAFTPQSVLAPVYARMRELSRAYSRR